MLRPLAAEIGDFRPASLLDSYAYNPPIIQYIFKMFFSLTNYKAKIT
jgi:hypothetical protein